MSQFIGFGNAQNGIGTSASNIQTSISVTSGSTSATFGSGAGFTDGDAILIHQSRNGGSGVGNWEFNKIASGGGTTSVTLILPAAFNYDTTAQVYLMKQYSSYNGALSVGTSWDGTKGGIAGFFCSGEAIITGGGGNGFGFRGTATDKTQGEGTGGAGGASTAANGNGGGGGTDGGPQAHGGGGGGGNGAVGTDGEDKGAGNGGTGGAVAGSADLTTMVFGGAGGMVGVTEGGSSGYGGGLICVVAKTITFTGSFTANGAVPTGLCQGGGAGGSILLKGQTITLGSLLVTATGAAGSGGTASGGAGGAGAVGRIRVEACSVTGTTNPSASEGFGNSWCGSIASII